LSEISQAIVNGTIDQEGRLVEADPRLLALQLGAGGVKGGALMIPQLAALARLAHSLGVMVSRNVMAADGERDVDLWVRAFPDAGQVRLAIGGWAERSSEPVSAPDEAARAREMAKLGADGHWATDANLRFTALSNDFLAIASDDGRDLAGRRITRVLRLIENDNGDMPLLNALADGTPFAGQLAELREGQGAKLWLHGANTVDAIGQFSGFKGGFRWADRTITIPESAPERVAAPTNGFAHKLDVAIRTPLGRIIAEADQISARAQGPLADDYVGYAGDIAAAGRHLLSLVDDLADVQAVEGDNFRVTTEAIDLADIARRAAGLLGVRALDRRVAIDPPEDDEILMARGDFRRVLQIMVNLIGNAVRYSPDDAMVWVRSEQEGDLAAMIVADQGKGIAFEDQERIFEKFERVDVTEPGGSGLGLYISRRLARAMGGDISVDSAPGMGARFILTLPVA
jgi:hypothetical protein